MRSVCSASTCILIVTLCLNIVVTMASTASAPASTATASSSDVLQLEHMSGHEAEGQLTVGGDSLKLDALGPIILNSDGTISRITNWHAYVGADMIGFGSSTWLCVCVCVCTCLITRQLQCDEVHVSTWLCLYVLVFVYVTGVTLFNPILALLPSSLSTSDLITDVFFFLSQTLGTRTKNDISFDCQA
jgi:hypothetical protein